MIDLATTRPTPTAFAVALGAAMITGQPHYPNRTETFEVRQIRGTHSDFMESITKSLGAHEFAQQLAKAYHNFAEGQKRLDEDFEAALYDDLTSLYEA